METVKVFWKDKFAGRPVTINVADFDPEIHSMTPWPAEEVEPEGDDEPDAGLESHTVAELREMAAEKGVELKSSMTKAQIIEAMEG